ncbi:MAG TPA: haloacid dehalogenase, partial [Chloroflexi bacterium]|nr:haloacid dehalogenase [Chloroflexota bacterium]
MTSMDSVVASITSELEVKQKSRDRALVDSRQIVRHAATCIRALHRGEFDKANESLQQGRAMVAATRAELAEHP